MLASLFPLLSTAARLAAAYAAPTGFDVNDLSVLFPTDAGTGQVYPEIPLGAPLLTPALWGSVSSFATTNTKIGFRDGIEQAANWRVVSFRYDPCSPGLGARKGEFRKFGVTDCQQQIRLVAQPFAKATPQTGTGFFEDYAVHLVYTVGVGAPKADDAILADLLALKAASPTPTSGVPLQTHPGLAQAGPASELADRFRNFLFKHLSAEKMTTFTMMGIPSAQAFPWIFFGGSVSGGSWKVSPIPGLEGGNKALSVTANGLFGHGRFEPHGKGPLSTEDFRDPDPVMHRVNNPRLAHIHNVDCASCHTAGPLSVGFGALADLGRPGDRYIPAPGITAFVPGSHAVDSNWDFRAFGYLRNRPAVNLRTLNDTAEVTNFVNTEVLKVKNPGLDCSASEKAVFDCMLLFGADAEKCLSTCAPGLPDRRDPGSRR